MNSVFTGKAIEHKPKILVYGIDKVGCTVPKEDIETKTCKLHFEPFLTKEKFQDYAGVILFQGIFEEHIAHEDTFGSPYTVIDCYEDELQRRKKQYDLLMEKKGFACVILIKHFHMGREQEITDLSTWALNYDSFYKENYGNQITSLAARRNEFESFIDHFGAAHTRFTSHNNALDIKVICAYSDDMTGMIFGGREFFVPSLKPEKHELEEYFKVLSDAVISTHKKLSEEIPAWADEYRFEEEKRFLEEKKDLLKHMDKIDENLLRFKGYKKVICFSDELLRENVSKLFSEGMGFKINNKDELKEDFKIIDEKSEPLVLVEVKGTNKGVKREHVNQADSHRERAGLGENFPSSLVINTHIKASNSIQDKYQEIAKEQIVHAAKMNILVMRTIDLLNMLYLKEKKIVTTENFLNILKKENGWLKVSRDSWNIIHGNE